MKLELSIDQIQILGRALHQLPYGQVAPLIAEIDSQLLAQQQPAGVERVQAPDKPTEPPAKPSSRRNK